MTDVNEQSFSAGINTDSAVAQAARPQGSQPPEPIWRFRPALQPDQRRSHLRTRIIPKIVLALRSTPKAPEPAKQESPSAIVQFAALVLGDRDVAAFAFVQEVMIQGMSVESVFIDLLAPTARHLGELWESDATDFANVTLGVGRLQLIMRQLGEAFFEQGSPSHGGEFGAADDNSRRATQLRIVDGRRIFPPGRLEFVHRAVFIAPGIDFARAQSLVRRGRLLGQQRSPTRRAQAGHS